MKVRLRNAYFQMVNRCGYSCLIKYMEPGSCGVACISDYCTRIGFSQFTQHYSMKQHKDLLLCENFDNPGKCLI